VQVGARARLGALTGADEPLPPQLRLFGGGPRGVRGVPVNLLGPRILQLRDAGACGAVPDCEGVRLDPGDVLPRAAGGDLLLETGIEARWWISSAVQLAAFVDYGSVRSRGGDAGALAGTRTESVATPGIGILALSPLGPLRLDVAYNPSPARRYPVLVRDDGADGYRFAGFALYDPFTYDDPDAWTQLRRRLQFQISSGAPF
jgi:outer membrane protein assembly factor BamA